MTHKILTAIVTVAMLVGCGGHKKDAKSFEQILESSTGHPHKVVKLNTDVDGYVVYQDQTTGEYVAYNMNKFDREKMTSMEQYMAGAVEGVDIARNLSGQSSYVQNGYWNDIYDTYYYTDYQYDDYCACYREVTYSETVWVGREWVDTSYWQTWYIGGGFVFDNTSGASKDLETVESLSQQVAQKFVAHKLASEFSLSEARADELAKTISKYHTLENTRELTTAEKDIFAESAIGMSYSKMEAALKDKAQGSDVAYKELLKKAAETNATSPEQIGKFFDEYMN